MRNINTHESVEKSNVIQFPVSIDQEKQQVKSEVDDILGMTTGNSIKNDIENTEKQFAYMEDQLCEILHLDEAKKQKIAEEHNNYEKNYYTMEDALAQFDEYLREHHKETKVGGVTQISAVDLDSEAANDSIFDSGEHIGSGPGEYKNAA